MKTGFIGAGNMASAIIRGMIRMNASEAESINVFDIDTARCRAISSEYAVTICKDEFEVIEKSDIVVLAVKPYVLETLLPKIKASMQNKKPLIVSIAVGKTLEYIKNLLSYDAAIIRVMPNINAKVGGAMSACCANSSVSEKELCSVLEIFKCVGGVTVLEESKFSAFAAVSASSPAFTYMYIDALARSGVKNGMNKKQALQIAAQSVLGSAKMILESSEHPWELVDQVCSPGGTTIEGVASLQDNSFESAVLKAIDAVIAKDSKM